MPAKMCFKDYINCDADGLGATRKKMNKKSHKGRHYGTDKPDAMNPSSDGGMMTGSGPGVGVGMGESREIIESTEAFTPQFFPNLMWSYRPKNMVHTRGAHYVNQNDEYDEEGDYYSHDEDRTPEEDEESVVGLDDYDDYDEHDYDEHDYDEHDYDEHDYDEHDYDEHDGVGCGDYEEFDDIDSDMSNMDALRSMMDYEDDDALADEEEEEMAGAMPSNDNVYPERSEEKDYDNSLNDFNDDPDEDLEDAEMGDQANQDPNRQGMIRTVPNAHLVYKRQSEESDEFEELWVYKLKDGELKSGMSIRKQILSGTDIPRNKTRSADGEQTSHTWTAGNVQFLEIKGLPN